MGVRGLGCRGKGRPRQGKVSCAVSLSVFLCSPESFSSFYPFSEGLKTIYKGLYWPLLVQSGASGTNGCTYGEWYMILWGDSLCRKRTHIPRHIHPHTCKANIYMHTCRPDTPLALPLTHIDLHTACANTPQLSPAA